MSRSLPHNVNQLVSKPAGNIKRLLDQLAIIETLNNTLHDKLNATLSPHARVINLRKSTLVIAVDSPVWASRLRFQLTDLLSAFRESGFQGLANIEVIVQPR